MGDTDTLGCIAKAFEDMLETLQKTKRDRLVLNEALDHNEEEHDVDELKCDEELDEKKLDRSNEKERDRSNEKELDDSEEEEHHHSEEEEHHHSEEEELDHSKEELDHNNGEELDHSDEEEYNAELLKRDRVKTYQVRRRRCGSIKMRNQTVETSFAIQFRVERRERFTSSKKRRRHDSTSEDATTASKDSCEISDNDDDDAAKNKEKTKEAVIKSLYERYFPPEKYDYVDINKDFKLRRENMFIECIQESLLQGGFGEVDADSVRDTLAVLHQEYLLRKNHTTKWRVAEEKLLRKMSNERTADVVAAFKTNHDQTVPFFQILRSANAIRNKRKQLLQTNYG
jgi:hypothetical protein